MPTETIKKTAVRKTAVKKAVTAKKVETSPTEEVEVVALKTPAVAKKSTSSTGKYVFATGRRKTAIANARVYDAEGELTINKQPAKKYFSAPFLLDTAVQGFKLTGRGGSLKVEVGVTGGGPNSQAVAVRHALARALLLLDEGLRPVLKKNGLLTRDSREKERKKFGLKRARRAPQWAKR